MASNVSRICVLVFSLGSAALLATGCGRFEARHDSGLIADQIKQEMFTEPTSPLTPSSPAWAQPYSVYNLVDAKFAVDAKVQSISARIEIQSTAGKENVELVGALRPDGSASLADLAPMADGKNRLVGEAICADIGVCQKIILNVYYNVAGKTLKKQFSSDALKADESPAPTTQPSNTATAKDDANEPDEAAGDFVGPRRNEVLIGKLWKRAGSPELPPTTAPAAKPAAAAKTPAKPSQKISVDFKGMKPSQSVTVKLPALTPVRKKTPPAQVQPSAVKSVVKAIANHLGLVPTMKTPTKPVLPKATKGSSTQVQDEEKSKAGPSVTVKLPPARPVTPAAPAAPATPPAKTVVATKPVAVPAPPAPPVRQPLPVKPQPQPIQALPGKPAQPPASPAPADTQPDAQQPDVSVTSDATIPAEALTPDLPFPPALVDTDAEPLDQKIEALEIKLAPLMNLRNGGIAYGSYGPSSNPKSAIENANLLMPKLGLVPMQITANAHYGTGMLVSFLENAAAYLFRQLGLTLFVGDMSLKYGGSFGPSSSHNTHRNGLDADIAWLGLDQDHALKESALDRNGRMNSNFDYEKTWDFLTLAGHQELIYDAEKTTAISRVYMSQPVKAGFCKWTKGQGLYKNPFNQELLQLIRPTPNHVKHFHLSLKCSPHYPFCRNLAPVPVAGTGC